MVQKCIFAENFTIKTIMKNYFKKRTLLLAVGCMLMLSCSKDDSKDESVNEVNTYSLVSDTTLPGEVVEIKTSVEITQPEIDVMLNNKAIKAYANGAYSYVFITPVLTSGDYTLKLADSENENFLKLKVKDYVAITNPEEVINDFVVSRDKCFEAIKAVGSSPETLLLIDQIKEEWELQYSKNSVEDKMLLAYILKKNTVNPEWFTASSEYPDSYYSRASVLNLDAGEKLVASAKEFVTAQTVCLASIPALVGTGTFFLSAPNFVTGAVFVATFTVFIVSREVAIRKAQDVGSLKAVAEAISNVSYNKTAGLVLVKDVDSDVSMKINFRNLKASDLNIQADITKAFNQEKSFTDEDSKVKILYDKAIKFTEKLKGLYVNHTSRIGQTAESSMVLTVLDKDIIVQGSSNPKVAISTSLKGEIRKIKATSTSTEDINFNLKIAYKRAIDGKVIVSEIPCVYKATESLIGTWAMESFNKGVPIGGFDSVVFGSQCPNLIGGSYTYISEVIEFAEMTYSVKSSSKHIYYNKQVDKNCVVTDDKGDTQEIINDSFNGAYELKGDVLVTKEGNEVFENSLIFISSNKISIGDNVYVRK
jgi:hypothetical protein